MSLSSEPVIVIAAVVTAALLAPLMLALLGPAIWRRLTRRAALSQLYIVIHRNGLWSWRLSDASGIVVAASAIAYRTPGAARRAARATAWLLLSAIGRRASVSCAADADADVPGQVLS